MPMNKVKLIVASVLLELADGLIRLRRTAAAQQDAEAGCALAATLRERDPTIATWQSFVTNCHLVRARLALAGGSAAAALVEAQSALQSATSEDGLDPIKTRYRMALAYRLIGEAHRLAGDNELARQAWTAGLAQLPANTRERPREMIERAVLLRDLGKSEEARVLSEQLRAGGFRRRD